MPDDLQTGSAMPARIADSDDTTAVTAGLDSKEFVTRGVVNGFNDPDDLQTGRWSSTPVSTTAAPATPTISADNIVISR